MPAPHTQQLHEAAPASQPDTPLPGSHLTGSCLFFVAFRIVSRFTASTRPSRWTLNRYSRLGGWAEEGPRRDPAGLQEAGQALRWLDGWEGKGASTRHSKEARRFSRGAIIMALSISRVTRRAPLQRVYLISPLIRAARRDPRPWPCLHLIDDLIHYYQVSEQLRPMYLSSKLYAAGGGCVP